MDVGICANGWFVLVWNCVCVHRGLPGPSLNSRGLTGRKKSDGLLSAGGTNLAVSSLIGELSAISHESPPRGGNNGGVGGGDDAAESDTSSVASSMEKLNEDFSLLPEQWYENYRSSSASVKIILGQCKVVTSMCGDDDDDLDHDGNDSGNFTHRPGKLCAFCNLGERSMLGQGDLQRVEIPEGFDPVAVATRLTLKNKTEKDVNNEKSQKTGLSCRRQKGAGKMKYASVFIRN